ncbi:thioredoxin family protein [Dyadobacter fanqingshengii]|uniref:Thioredoxin family protein n=1 Tax=Dyadobacter fanqingshengii TaxID=2906443 RepID=A0A9X1TFD2_9BACT|nr:thioredoxin family protein [Dyadobacter fanqingshengii]MCF0039382.1 thioredoxin family protein [Dyadobacter fanqingshengii]USJ33804.1 thioredoxin family protein [Dyadobacter fanqingshengii]
MKICLWILMILGIGLFTPAEAIDSRLLLNEIGPVVSQTGGYQVGDAAASFRLKSTDGSMVSLNDFNNAKGVIVIFTSNHCPFAKAYEDRIIALNNKFASQGFPVIAINPSDPGTHQDDTFEKLKERAASKGYGYPYLVDDSQQVAKAFGAGRTPQVYILQKNGAKFTVRYIGMIDDNPQDPAGVTKLYADEAVSNLLTGKPVVTTITKPVGCAIKWKN